MAEEWRAIKGCSRYGVSSLGRVRIDTPSPRARMLAGQVLTTTAAANGRLRVRLVRDDGGRRMAYVHVLVYEAFVGDLPSHCYLRHRDGDSKNNAVDNLTVVSKRRLVDVPPDELARLCARMTQRDVATLYGVGQSTIQRALRGAGQG